MFAGSKWIWESEELVKSEGGWTEKVSSFSFSFLLPVSYFHMVICAFTFHVIASPLFLFVLTLFVSTAALSSEHSELFPVGTSCSIKYWAIELPKVILTDISSVKNKSSGYVCVCWSIYTLIWTFANCIYTCLCILSCFCISFNWIRREKGGTL